LPEGESVVTPPSRCPNCRARIAWWDNIPLLSYLLLRGRCRSCGAGISLRYPAVEAANGMLYAAVALKHGAPADALGLAAQSAVFTAEFGKGILALAAWLLTYLAFPTALLVLALIDLDKQLLPDKITKPGIVTGIAISAWAVVQTPVGTVLGSRLCRLLCVPAALLECVVAACLGYLSVWVVYHSAKRYYRHWKKEDVEPMGFGDAKLLAMMGAFRGSVGLWIGGFIGTVLGGLYGIGLLAARRAGGRTPIPLGTFLCAGAILELLAGAELLAWYRGLFLH
jgi:leader peptidase (prepilin peptidase)/N-methyltransferase